MKADVVIIGAGAAGLAAARVLAQHPLDVVVLEARDRAGGRIWSVPSPDGSPPMELGAEFIHGPAEETRALLARSGGVALETGGENWMMTGGTLERTETDFSVAGTLLAGARDLPQDESVAHYLQRFANDDAKRAAVENARIFAEGFDAADPAVASAWSIADEIRSGVDFTSAWPSAGYPPVVAELVDACTIAGAGIRLSTVVRAIRWRRGGVEIDTTDGSGESYTVAARAAIVTLPVGVLRALDDGAIAFTPELPARARAALTSLEMGHVVKVIMRFATPFWETTTEGRYRGAGFFRDAGHGPFAIFWTQAPIHSALVVAWVGGPDAKRLRDATSAERIELAIGQFGTMLGDPAAARAAFAGGATHDWVRDPFARGAYSYVLTGGAEARRTLAQPIEETLFFAGEATSIDGQGGTVNGAIRTGERAAWEALRAFPEKGASR